MGWDYYTFMEQPEDFIQIILARMQAEGLARDYWNKKYGVTN